MKYKVYTAMIEDYESDEWFDSYPDQKPSIESRVIFKDAIDRLSDDAKTVVNIILNSPEEIMNIPENKGCHGMGMWTIIRYIKEYPLCQDLKCRSGASIYRGPFRNRESRRIVDEIKSAVMP